MVPLVLLPLALPLLSCCAWLALTFCMCFSSLPAFYTNKYGYKMCLRIYLNGDGTGRGTHLSLFFVVMKGPSDALLRWPFNQKVSFGKGKDVECVQHSGWLQVGSTWSTRIRMSWEAPGVNHVWEIYLLCDLVQTTCLPVHFLPHYKELESCFV